MAEWKPSTLLHPDGEREYTPTSEREERELITAHGYRRKDASKKKTGGASTSSAGSSSS